MDRDRPAVTASADELLGSRVDVVVEAVSSIFPDDSPVERSLRGGLYAVVEGQDNFPVESMASYGEITGMIIGARSRHTMIYRPRHFIGHEVPIGIARMMIFREPVASAIGQIPEVVAAKKPLKAGTVLDGEGGYATYGMVERAEKPGRNDGFPSA